MEHERELEKQERARIKQSLETMQEQDPQSGLYKKNQLLKGF